MHHTLAEMQITHHRLMIDYANGPVCMHM